MEWNDRFPHNRVSKHCRSQLPPVHIPATGKRSEMTIIRYSDHEGLHGDKGRECGECVFDAAARVMFGSEAPCISEEASPRLVDVVALYAALDP
jgi:hypothetical protein